MSQELPREEEEDTDSLLNAFKTKSITASPVKPKGPSLIMESPHPLFAEQRELMSQQLDYSQYFNNQSQANIHE